MIGDMPRSEDFLDLGDLVNALLAAAVGISQSVFLLAELSARSVGADELTVLAPITDAITLLTAARLRLIDEADRPERPGFRKVA